MTVFRNYKRGDKVWHITKGWVEIDSIDSTQHPINTRFDNFTVDGKAYEDDLYPTIYPNEFKVPAEAFKKPLPDLKVDTKVIVWNKDDKAKYHRHFKWFTKDGEIVCFVNGTTSWSNDGDTIWDYYEVFEDDKK